MYCYVASAVAMLYLHDAATERSSKRASVTNTKFLDAISCSADRYQSINKIWCAKLAMVWSMIVYNTTISPQQVYTWILDFRL